MNCKNDFSEVKGNAIYQRIHFLLKETNINTTKFYQETGITRQALARWKQGSLPSSDIVIIISEYFHVSAYWLLTGKHCEQADIQTYKQRFLLELEKFKSVIEQL